MKTIFLLSACVATLTLSFGRAPSDTSRRSSQQEEVLTSLAAIKAATAKIEQCLATNDAVALSSIGSDSASDRSNSPASEATDGVSISQEEITALVNAVYTKAIAGIKDVAPLALDKKNISGMVLLGKQIQLILNPSQAIANELAPQFIRISNSSEVKQLRNMIVAAAQASESLIKDHDKYLKSKIYKKHVDQLKEMQEALNNASAELMVGIIRDKAKSKDSADGAYYISVIGQSLINTFSKEYAKLGLMRQYAVNDDGSLLILDAQNPISADSVEDDVVIHMIEVLEKLSTSQLDLTLSGVVMDHMTFLKSGINLPSISAGYYAVRGQKVFETSLKDGRYSFNENAKPAHILTEQELVALTGTVNALLKAALEKCNFKSPKFAPIRMLLKAKMDLTVAESVQEATAEDQ